MNYIRFHQIPSMKIDCLIINEFGSELIKECLPDGCRSEIVPVRNSLPYILNLSYFVSLLKKIILGRLKRIIFFEALIATLKPKVIITFNDNSSLIGKLQEKFPDMLAISVQNGVRIDHSLSLGGWDKNFSSQYYYGFGDYEKDLMLQKGAHCKGYFKAGSLKMGVILSQKSLKIIKDKYDICFVSYFRQKKDSNLQKNIKDALEINKHLFNLIVKICKIKNYSVCVAMFSEYHNSGVRTDSNYKSEIGYYKNGNVEKIIDFIPNDFIKMVSYKSAMESKCVIGLLSTLLFEMFGFGKRTLFGNLLLYPRVESEKKLLGKMSAENILHEMELEHIKGKIETLMNMTEEEYLNKTEFARNYYMRCERPYPHEMIKKQITEHLNIPTE